MGRFEEDNVPLPTRRPSALGATIVKHLPHAAALFFAAISCGDTTLTTSDGTKITFDSNLAVVAERPACPFIYTKSIRDLVLPIARAKLGSAVGSYDIDKPGVVLYRLRAEISIGPKIPNSRGGYPTDPDELIVVLDVCSHAIEKSYFISTMR
jgi:hypothetical protein